MIRIVIADDHQMVREGLRSLLRGVPQVEVVGEAEDGRSAVKMAQELLPDIILMDIAMPGFNGTDATRQLTANGDGTKVIALSGHSNAHAAREMLDAGACAFVRKESAFSELKDALKSVMESHVYISPSIAESVNAEIAGAKAGAAAGLTIRERSVLQLMAEGKSTKEIAFELDVSGKTIESHRRNLMGKLNLFSVAELTKYAIREGITSV